MFNSLEEVARFWAPLYSALTLPAMCGIWATSLVTAQAIDTLSRTMEASKR